ncbi:MAG TPA: helix-turn-helix domain-containing protein [Pyrinomonadaceae bacterium]
MDARVLKVIETMRRRFQRPLSVGSMAASVNLSPSRFQHLFKVETGVAPLSYLKALRIEEARKLLETTFLTNQEIIARVGIRDDSHFARDFKKAHGLSPGQYRARHYSQNTPPAPAGGADSSIG